MRRGFSVLGLRPALPFGWVAGGADGGSSGGFGALLNLSFSFGVEVEGVGVDPGGGFGGAVVSFSLRAGRCDILNHQWWTKQFQALRRIRRRIAVREYGR